jgi:hypothetical protein
MGLAMLAAGAILTFAVSARVPGINLRLAGLIIMATGIVALITPSRVAVWLRRRTAVHGEPATEEPDEADEADEDAYPSYLLQDPAVLAAEVLNSLRPQRSGTSRATGQRTLHSIGQDSQDEA